MAEACDRLRDARIKSGRSPVDLAASCGISPSSYHDLEAFSDDLYMSMSLSELAALCRAIGIKMTDLFAEGLEVGKQMTFSELAARVKAHIEENHQSLDEFENSAGWEIAAFLQIPDAAWDWNIDCLRDVCKACRVNWTLLLPE